MAADADVRALGQRVLDAYRLDPQLVVSLTIDMQATGVPLVCVRLLLTDAALEAMHADDLPDSTP